MKNFVAVVGLGLLVLPLLRHLSFRQRVESSNSTAELLAARVGVSGGLMLGLFGLMALGVLVDGGKGYRKPALLIAMMVIGALWCAFYPAGWLLGIPLVVYPLGRRLGFGAPPSRKDGARSRENNLPE